MYTRTFMSLKICITDYREPLFEPKKNVKRSRKILFDNIAVRKKFFAIHI